MSFFEDFVAKHAPDARRRDKGYSARCPVPGHGKGRGDKNPSLSLNEGDGGCVLVTCHGQCPPEDVVAAWGLQMRDLFPPQAASPRRSGSAQKRGATFEGIVEKARAQARENLGDEPANQITYDYHAAGGALAFRVLRFEVAGGDKTFRPVHEGCDGWLLGYPIRLHRAGGLRSRSATGRILLRSRAAPKSRADRDARESARAATPGATPNRSWRYLRRRSGLRRVHRVRTRGAHRRGLVEGHFSQPPRAMTKIPNSKPAERVQGTSAVRPPRTDLPHPTEAAAAARLSVECSQSPHLMVVDGLQVVPEQGYADSSATPGLCAPVSARAPRAREVAA